MPAVGMQMSPGVRAGPGTSGRTSDPHCSEDCFPKHTPLHILLQIPKFIFFNVKNDPITISVLLKSYYILLTVQQKLTVDLTAKKNTSSHY